MKDVLIGLLPFGTCYLWERSANTAEKFGDWETARENHGAVRLVSPIEAASIFFCLSYVMTVIDGVVLHDGANDAEYALFAAVGFKLLALGVSFLPSRGAPSSEDAERR